MIDDEQEPPRPDDDARLPPDDEGQAPVPEGEPPAAAALPPRSPFDVDVPWRNEREEDARADVTPFERVMDRMAQQREPERPDSGDVPAPAEPAGAAAMPPPPSSGTPFTPERAAADAPVFLPPPPPVFSPGGHHDDGERYPMTFVVEYPQELSRGLTLVRGLLYIPVAIFAGILQYLWNGVLGAGWTCVFWRKKYPEWLFGAGTGYWAWTARAWAYGLLLTDKFPSLDAAGSPVQLTYAPPPQGELSRWRVVLWKFVLLIPHFLALAALWLGVVVVVVLAWFAILFTGRYPQGMFSFVTGVMRWTFRVIGYFASFNDRYPPFSLSESAGPAERTTTVACGVTGALAAGGMTVLIVVAAVIGSRPEHLDANYASLQQGRGAVGIGFTNLDDDRIVLRLERIYDPGHELAPPNVEVGRNERVVVFQWSIDNEQAQRHRIDTSDAALKAGVDGERQTFKAVVLVLDGEKAPEYVEKESEAVLQAVFVLPEDAEVETLRIRPGFAGSGGVEYDFR